MTRGLDILCSFPTGQLSERQFSILLDTDTKAETKTYLPSCPGGWQGHKWRCTALPRRTRVPQTPRVSRRTFLESSGVSSRAAKEGQTKRGTWMTDRGRRATDTTETYLMPELIYILFVRRSRIQQGRGYIRILGNHLAGSRTFPSMAISCQGAKE